MKVKIGNKIYDGANEPVMVILTPKDKENIANMAEHATKYCMYPDNTDVDWIFEWMNTGEEKKHGTKIS